VLGFGADGQYIDRANGTERTFGFFQTGVSISVPLRWLPESAGSLAASAGFDVVVLSDEDLSVDRDQVETVFRFGLSYAF
jgi:hypothetical protein